MGLGISLTISVECSAVRLDYVPGLWEVPEKKLLLGQLLATACTTRCELKRA